MDSLCRFRDAIQATGLEPPKIIEPGEFHRFPGIGKIPSNRAGWCRLFDDRQGGVFGDFSTGLSERWQARPARRFLPSDRAAFARRVLDARERAEAKRKTRQAGAASRAAAIWNSALPAPSDHPYLISKGIKIHGARLHKDMLMLPVTDFAGRLTSLQFIAPDGSKRLLSGGRKAGCFIPVTGHSAGTSKVILCEGWATGCTLAEDDPQNLVLAAIDAGNLESVALGARRRWPSAELVIATDDDRQTQGNPGLTKATAAAIAAGALLARPQWPEEAPESLTDFNDLARWLARSGS